MTADLFSLAGKVALVTGGSRGIGAMIARAFVIRGARVYISSRKAPASDALAWELSQSGDCRSIPADLSGLAGVRQLTAELSTREERLDILVNNAGAAWGAPIDDYPEHGWNKVMDLNLKSMFFLTQQLLPLLRASAVAAGPAKIINIASINGLRPPPFESYAYSASKAGAIMLTRHLAKRLAQERILVNAIAPGPFLSEMTAGTFAEHGDEVLASVPLGRMGEESDMAGVSIFLAAAASNYLTGAVIPCDGGSAEL